MSSENIRTVAILGAGTMGHGIAQVTAQTGFRTFLYDVTREGANAGLSKIKGALDRVVSKGKLSADEASSITNRITATADLGEAVSGADWVIEATPEIMDLKVSLFSKVAELAPATTRLASNTSSLSLTELGARTKQASRLIGLHFFNPPPVMELVEIVRGLSTTDATVDEALSFVKEIKKTPIVVNDVPGFASSRLGVALGAEAMRMVEQGVASPADIDRAMELGYRHPMGPLKLTDLVGLDVRLAILEHLHRELGEVFRPPVLLRQMVRAGKLGKKTGEGFYRWTDAGPEPITRR
ncbi:MAG: 3-hydroxyacyl-CoA dehydrogenase family protein [Polyangiaceae bacterium]